ncbi:uncharacterized protein LY89DRAFT_672043 [Mollisia scopiformis]|uniref:Peptidoglycan binding-like domain-containing protein n=1 Tax=Mollisia scopiformis TaxID=149040 RepID=A0A194X1P0_MOLSC|nr:uncharacterized protein LY89DRAFT_672043 [Mollisia scopiformis]KUJ13757.1 hypothetical protein LY89DRAFT_672043 [Mollisia scopiformis]
MASTSLPNRQRALSNCYEDRQKIVALPDLRPGDVNEAVAHVQNHLRHYGYLRENDTITQNVYDPVTCEAVMRYQRNTGNTATGVLDEQTKRTMMASRCNLPDCMRTCGH